MADVEIKKLKSSRGQVKSLVTRFTNFLNTFELANKSFTELAKRLERIEPLWDQFNKIQSEIAFLDDSDIQKTDLDKELSSFENTYFDVISRAQDMINTNNNSIQSQYQAISSATVQSNIQPTPLINVKLPPLNLPKFSGSYSEYLQFYDTFNSLIDQNQALSKVQKFYYLNSCLKGDAQNIVHSLEITEQNYDIAWDLLKKRYENKRIIINSHLKSIFELPTLTKENSQGLRSFLDSFLKDFRSLKNLGEPVDTWNSILVYILISKLDFSSKREWENSIKEHLIPPSIDDFIKFLTSRCQLLETIYINKNSGIESNKGTRGNPVLNNFSGQSKLKCYYCKENHCLYYCQKFINLTPQNRIKEVQKLNLCKNCLRLNHANIECTGQCKKCGKAHNTLLHIDNSSRQGSQNNQSPIINSGSQDQKSQRTDITVVSQGQTPQQSNNAVLQEQDSNIELSNNDSEGYINTHCSQPINTNVLLGTAEIFIKDNKNKYLKCRALLDGGSQSNFITRSLADKLQLKTYQASLPIVGIGGNQTNINQSVHTEIKSMHNNFSQNLIFLILNKITNNIPQSFQAADTLKIPENILLADPNFMISRQIDVLLGASIFYTLLSSGQIKLGKNMPILTKTTLGWIIAGPLQIISKNPQSCFLSTNDSNCLIQKSMEKLWEIENLQENNKPLRTKEESFCEKNFLDTHKRDDTGRFEVSLPLRDNFQTFVDQGQNHFHIAEKRLLNMEQKMSRDSNFEKLYKNFMLEYETLGHMTRLDKNQLTDKNEDTIINYLPHHGVYKESSKTTKLRVVFDASAKNSKNDLSLNDTLCVGPVIQEDLFSVLLRFRKHNFVMKADITKMYRQININPNQRNLQRILWRNNPNQEISQFVLNTVTYGTSPASFLAVRSLHQAAIDSSNEYPQASKIILSDFIVDDLISGYNTYEGLHLLKIQISDILKNAGFELTQWMFNCQNNTDQENFHILNTSDETVKTLGILWNPNQDIFQYVSTIKINFLAQALTKRIVLSIISQIFDPLGLIGPVLVTAKIILQELWKMHLNWDDPIPESHSEHFLNFFCDLESINKISVPRHVLLSTYITLQIHGFTDASMKAYGSCIYLRTVDSYDKVYCQLLTAKSRVAPIKSISVPRLELCGAVLLSKLVNKSIEALKINMDQSQIYLWTDSEIVLAWLSQEPSNWKIFIANRISEIQTLTCVKNWRYVSSADNPADIISRGTKPSDLFECDLWWSGPSWLLDKNKSWPVSKNKLNIDIPEKRNIPVNNISCHTVKSDFNLLSKFSNLNTLTNVTAYCLRFTKNARLPKCDRNLEPLSVKEVNNATDVLIRIIQFESFNQEINDIKNKGHVSRHSKLLSLNPFMENDILHVGGRLKHSNLSPNHKNQILLPNDHYFSELIIRHEHNKTLHGGIQTVLSSIRMKYWIINGKATIRKLLRKCLVCFKIKPSSITPIMGNLPSARVNPSMPFSSTGIDFAGPILVKDGTLRGRKLVKTYICVFVCFCTKAVHLELVGDLSTDSFKNALTRFIARRGICNDIYSDNGSNFRRANNDINDVYKKLIILKNDQAIKTFLMKNRVTWHFIPPRSPNFGGLWESAVKSMKYHLVRVIAEHHLTYENLYTILTQIESIMNSRPLCPLSNDPNDFAILTPGHFLIGRQLNALPEEVIENIPTNRLSKYQEIQKMFQYFWKRWSSEYLHNLQQRNKWMTNDAQVFKPGLLVLIRDDNVLPMNWKTGRICEIFPGSDQITRVVSVKTQTGTFKRAVNKLCVLPIEH